MTPMLSLLVFLAQPVQAAEPALYTGVVGAAVVDSGVIVVARGASAREETFEYIKRPDGGFTLVNTITAANGAYRVNGRFDYDAQWNATAARGTGVYDGKPVEIALQREPRRVVVTVSATGQGKSKPAKPTPKQTQAISVCDPTCLIDMAPSVNPMFVMTRQYDLARGGEQEFIWAGQDLVRAQHLTDDHVHIVLKDEPTVSRPGGAALKLRHFFFVERIPQPDGKMFVLDFDLWTDLDHRPMAFRVRPPGSTAVGTVGLRKGFEDLESQILPK